MNRNACRKALTFLGCVLIQTAVCQVMAHGQDQPRRNRPVVLNVAEFEAAPTPANTVFIVLSMTCAGMPEKCTCSQTGSAGPAPGPNPNLAVVLKDHAVVWIPPAVAAGANLKRITLSFDKPAPATLKPSPFFSFANDSGILSTPPLSAAGTYLYKDLSFDGKTCDLTGANPPGIVMQ